MSRVPPIADVCEHAHPEFGALAARASPQSEYIAVAVETDADCRVDRSVRDLPVSNFDDDRIDEYRCVHLVERAGGPVLYLLEHFVGDPRDGLFRDRGAWGCLPRGGRFRRSER